ncbi:hypothetical protein BDV36DRAFT_261372 [Aspergillus pseudocaelatus]|uniref:Uncharacterized protein n=1 Tax=Aspergillus pseudocaelatus TaxID=1825620 RepID=A0ABQ6WIC4_9EURO|nr:hypothetical protein BDV36DRAFT_261372 [Aspergillus pseudocaelatus]
MTKNLTSLTFIIISSINSLSVLRLWVNELEGRRDCRRGAKYGLHETLPITVGVCTSLIYPRISFWFIFYRRSSKSSKNFPPE